MKKIIPCLDIDNRKVVKGRKFMDVQEVADPLTQAKKYVAEGADELVFYDISASTTGRGLFYDLIEEIAKEVPVPFVVGGGIRTVEDVKKLIALGADKVSINSITIQNPNIVRDIADAIGSEKVVVSVDIDRDEDGVWRVFAKGGRENTGIDALEWVEKMESLGAGELVINSIAEDGVKDGYDIPLMRAIKERVSIPTVASGGAGKVEHFIEAATDGQADGLLAASVFHFDEVKIQDIKKALKEAGLTVKDE